MAEHATALAMATLSGWVACCAPIQHPEVVAFDHMVLPAAFEDARQELAPPEAPPQQVETMVESAAVVAGESPDLSVGAISGRIELVLRELDLLVEQSLAVQRSLLRLRLRSRSTDREVPPDEAAAAPDIESTTTMGGLGY